MISKNQTKGLMGLSLLYLTWFISLIFTAYCPAWYRFNFNFHNKYLAIGHRDSFRFVEQLNDFLWHRIDFLKGWTVKENVHLLEVRGLLDTLLIILIPAVILFVATFDKKHLPEASGRNIFISLIFALPVLFFDFFWTEIFHALLFSNDAWKLTPHDMSYYIMPPVFFLNSLIFIVIVSCLLNLLIRLSTKKFLT